MVNKLGVRLESCMTTCNVLPNTWLQFPHHTRDAFSYRLSSTSEASAQGRDPSGPAAGSSR